MTALLHLTVIYTRSHDPSPFAHLMAPESLAFTATDVTDIAPVSGRTLAEAATTDPTIRQLAALRDPTETARNLVVYLQEGVPSHGKHPSPRSFRQRS